MCPHLLRNAREYRAAVAEVDALLDEPGDAADRERLEFLSVLVHDYEDRTDPLDESAGSPREVVAFMLEQRGLARSELAPLMGGRARVSEFFSGRRRLSMEQVRSLRDALGVPGRNVRRCIGAMTSIRGLAATIRHASPETSQSPTSTTRSAK